MDSVRLSATHLLDDSWEPIGDAPAARGTKSVNDELVRQWIRATAIEIAPQAETVRLTGARGDPAADYLESEVGMNIILPRGRMEELRLKLTLSQTGGTQGTFAVDGFPNSSISNVAIVDGQVKIGISKAFKLIPVVGDALDELLSVDLAPWSFRIGTLKRVDVAFNGGLSPEPDWYFRRAGIQNDAIRVAMLLKMAPGTTDIKAEVQAGWLYQPGRWHSVRVGSDTKTVGIYHSGRR